MDRPSPWMQPKFAHWRYRPESYPARTTTTAAFAGSTCNSFCLLLLNSFVGGEHRKWRVSDATRKREGCRRCRSIRPVRPTLVFVRSSPDVEFSTLRLLSFPSL